MKSRRSFIKKTLATSALLSMVGNAFPADPDFAARQEARRKELLALLGDLPRHDSSKPPRLVRIEKHEGFTLEHLEFDFNGLEPVPGLLLIPDQLQKPAPCMLYCHAHFGTYGIGKDELLNGREVMPAYAPVYAKKGIVTLAIDSWCFGQRNHLNGDAHGESDTFKQMLWEGRTLFGMMLFDELRSIDYLLGRPEVDPKRLGVFGLSMGATKAWWLSAIDPRITACMDLCCMTDFDELIQTNNLSGHGVYYYLPGLLKKFNTSTINQLIVPRPHLSLNGRLDRLTPPRGVDKVRDYLLPLYRRHGREKDLRIELFDCGHEELPAMRQIIDRWLDDYLVKA